MTAATITRGGYLIDGATYPRVSSILALLAKPGIESWKRKVGFEEADRIAERATTFGTLVHRGCERVCRGEPVADVVAAYERAGDLAAAQCVGAFGRWLSSAVADVLDVERTVWSSEHGYAGTADLLVVLEDGRFMVADIKTSKSLSESYRLQLEAYRMALEEQGEPFDGRLVVWLPSTHPGRCVAREYTDHAADRRSWRALLALYHWQRACRDDWRAEQAMISEDGQG